MREHEYRAWHKGERRMFKVYLLQWYGGVFLIGDRDSEHGRRCGSGEVELMEYTGLRDKQGKKIFEGDIVTYLYNSPTGIHEQKKVVTWNDKAAAFEVPTHGIFSSNIEIVGNIYENKEK